MLVASPKQPSSKKFKFEVPEFGIPMDGSGFNNTNQTTKIRSPKLQLENCFGYLGPSTPTHSKATDNFSCTKI